MNIKTQKNNKMVIVMRESSKKKIKSTLKIIDKMFYDNETINYYSVSDKGNVSIRFLYDHQEIRDKISYYKNFNSLSVEEKFHKLNSENKELLKRLEKYDDYFLDFYITHSN